MSLRRIDFATAAARVLILRYHKEGYDRCSVLTFNNRFETLQGFTTDESQLDYSLANIVPANNTRLYDSICDAVDYFREFGSDKPWLIIVVTDGEDNLSHRNEEECGRYIYNYYNNRASNFIFTVGVGSDVNDYKMMKLSEYGHFRHFKIESFSLLERIFVSIMLEVSQELSYIGLTDGINQAGVASVQTNVNLVPIDYAFLIDKSLSMATHVTSIQTQTHARVQPQIQYSSQQSECGCCCIQ